MFDPPLPPPPPTHKEWIADMVYIQSSDRDNQNGSIDLTNRLNELQQTGWDIYCIEVIPKYYVLIVASKEV